MRGGCRERFVAEPPALLRETFDELLRGGGDSGARKAIDSAIGRCAYQASDDVETVCHSAA
jgi:hypothetical protein